MSPPRQAGSKRYAFLVASGIFLSRIAGLVRDRVSFGHYFGLSNVADAFKAALRIPNVLQNLSAKACSPPRSFRYTRASWLKVTRRRRAAPQAPWLRRFLP